MQLTLGKVLIGLTLAAVVAAVPVEEETTNATNCFYRGKVYGDGDRMPELQEDNPCRIGCICNVIEGSAFVNCAQINCPIWFTQERKPGCVVIRQKDVCCPQLKCPEEDGTFKDAGATCTYKNRTYIEGQTIDGIEDPCMNCLCSPKFTGPGGPGCSVLSCLIRLPAPGCKPKEHPGFCCPNEYDCPDDTKV